MHNTVQFILNWLRFFVANESIPPQEFFSPSVTSLVNRNRKFRERLIYSYNAVNRRNTKNNGTKKVLGGG